MVSAKVQREFEAREQRQRLDRIFLAVTNTPETYSAADTVRHMDNCKAEDCNALANAIGYSHFTPALQPNGGIHLILSPHREFGWIGFKGYCNWEVKVSYN